MHSQTAPEVAVLGLGYIGLPTAAAIARSGSQVLGVDTSAKVVETVSRGEIHIQEIDLDRLVQGLVADGRLRASREIAPADVFLIAVPTPLNKNMQPDIGHILDSATSIAAVLKPGDKVILESTSPVGTTEKLRDRLAALRPDLEMPGLSAKTPDIAIAYCPERVLPGRILEELVGNDRCIGGITPRCARKALTFYRRFVRGECVTTSARAAEMTKLVENAYRDVNIAFANELSVIADRMEIDIWEVIALANRHPRVGILQPGPGVGGHCIAVDPWFIVDAAPEAARLIRTAREVNDAKPDYVARQAAALIESVPGAPVACFGLAFKANIDDFRESPAMTIAAKLARRFGQRIRIVEPYADRLPDPFDGTGARLIDIDEAIESCPVFIALVDHDVFKSVPLGERADKIVYDARGLWPDQPDYAHNDTYLRLAS